MARKKILAICGSTRSNSSNENILKGIEGQYRAEFDLHIYHSITDLPHFNPDLEGDTLPPSVIRFQNALNDADGVIICTPEYVFSLPGVLKNALEWTIATTIFLDKPVGTIVASGMGEKAFESLKIIMQTVGAKMNDDSEILITGARSKFDAQGNATDDGTRVALDKMVTAFVSML